MASERTELGLPDLSALSEEEKHQVIAVMQRAKEFEAAEEKSLMRQPLEGLLYKYTNVMKGWQYRWFVLEPETGRLEYYEKEEQKKVTRPRGYVHLAGAVISPSDEDSQTFTVNAANSEVYRLRAFDAKERQHWVNRLRATAEYHTDSIAQVRQNAPPLPKENRPQSFGSQYSLQSHGKQNGSSDNIYSNSTVQTTRSQQPKTLSNMLKKSRSQQKGAAPGPSQQVSDSFRQVKDVLSQVQNQEATLTKQIEDLPQSGEHINSLDKEMLLLKATSSATLECLEQCLSILQQQQQYQQQRQVMASSQNASANTIEWLDPKNIPGSQSSKSATSPVSPADSFVSAASLLENKTHEAPQNDDPLSHISTPPLRLSGACSAEGTPRLHRRNSMTQTEEVFFMDDINTGCAIKENSGGNVINRNEAKAKEQVVPVQNDSTAGIAIPIPAGVDSGETRLSSSAPEVKKTSSGKKAPPRPPIPLVRTGSFKGSSACNVASPLLNSSTSGSSVNGGLSHTETGPPAAVITAIQSNPTQTSSICNPNKSKSVNTGKVVKICHDEEVVDDEEYSDTDLGGVEEHKSVILHLLSQLKLGMDLTKVVLPTFILEKRSLLEMFADCMAHPDIFLKIPDLPDAESRMIAVIEWYLTSFHASRKGSVAKKPYNPIIGETFHCSWRVPKACTQPQGGGVEMPTGTQDCDQLYYLAEQVSHHPPISAFYFESVDKQMSMNASIWTKSKFMGMSIGVVMVGKVSLKLLSHDEEYTFTLPSAYARSILTVPWVELGDRVMVNCQKTGYSAGITFHTKPFYGGKLHRITTEAKNPAGEIFCRINGEWNGNLEFTFTNGTSKHLDTKTMQTVHKCVRPIDQQGEMESRRLWKKVTSALRDGDINNATEHKRFLEERQRRAERQRKESNTRFPTKFFHESSDGHWLYSSPLKAGQTEPTI